MQLTELKHILMIGNQINSLTDVIFASFRYIANQFVNSSTIKAKNTLSINDFQEVYVLKRVENHKTFDKSSFFIKNPLQTELNTATVYINGSNCDLSTPASAYRLHPGLMLFPQHTRRKHRANF